MKLVKFTSSLGGDVYVNPDKITMLSRSINETCIHFDFDEVTVSDSLEDVARHLAGMECS